METKLHQVFHNVAIALNERELKSKFIDAAGEIFEAKAWGWKVLDRNFQIVDCELMGLSDRIVDRYRDISYSIDPLMNYAIEHHAPVHERVLFTLATTHVLRSFVRETMEIDPDRLEITTALRN